MVPFVIRGQGKERDIHALAWCSASWAYVVCVESRGVREAADAKQIERRSFEQEWTSAHSGIVCQSRNVTIFLSHYILNSKFDLSLITRKERRITKGIESNLSEFST